MTIKNLVRKIESLSSSQEEAEQILVELYILQNQEKFNSNHMTLDYWDVLIEQNIKQEIALNLLPNMEKLTLSDLVECFELMVPAEEKKEKGVVYTLEEIKSYIVETVSDKDTIPMIIDPACGCGSFLITAAEILSKKYDVRICDVIQNNLCGLDIDSSALRKSKILLSLLALMNGETSEISFNLYCGNALDKNFLRTILEQRGKFDCVIGNPPYVRFRNIPEIEKEFFSNWTSAKSGNVDLYMPFFESGLYLLKDDGVLGFITSNGYLQGINGRALRNYFTESNYGLDILDFRDAQVFKNVTSYTCITFVYTTKNHGIINYVRINEQETILHHTFTQYEMKKFGEDEPWRMREEKIDNIIFRLENSGTPLGNWKIRNGLATLKNDLFFFTPESEDDKYYYRTYDGNIWKIEKGICIKVAKPNVIKNELDLENNRELAIFPYKKNLNGFSILNEEVIKTSYPETFKLLLAYKKELESRDKGHGNYPSWFAYGRTQGMNNFGKKLLIPYIAGKPTAVLSLDSELLFYCGYALISDDEEELRILKAFMESDAFWYYIFHTSKPYSKGYMAFAKNYLVNFTIPVLSESEKKYILSYDSKEDLNDWIWKKYQINEKEVV